MKQTTAPLTTTPFSLDRIKSSLQNKRLPLVATETGLSYPTIARLAEGEHTNYTMDTLLKVSQWIIDNDEREKSAKSEPVSKS